MTSVDCIRPSDSADHSPGTSIADRYEVIKELGSGKMGAVFLTRDMENGGSAVALKLFSSQFNRPNVQRLLEGELEQAKSLDHPNLVKVLDWGRLESGEIYLTREYVEGCSLMQAAIQETGPDRPVDVVRQVMIQLLSALEYLHSRGIMHGDLNRSNVLWNNDRIVLTDVGDGRVFSFFRRLKNRRSECWSGLPFNPLTVARTISPEEFSDKPQDCRSEIYRAATVAYELATGSLPFTNDWFPEVLRRQLKERFPPLSSHREDCPGWYQAIIDKASQKDPKRRFQTVAEMRQCFEERTAPVESNRLLKSVRRFIAGRSQIAP